MNLYESIKLVNPNRLISTDISSVYDQSIMNKNVKGLNLGVISKVG